jgi:hypothetical protein
VASRQTFTGGGMTLGIDGVRSLGESCFSLYGSARGAVLFGKGRQETTASITDIDATGVRTDSATITKSGGFDILSVLELEAGVQWTKCVGNCELFLRPSVVSQVYYDGGSSTSRSGDFGLFGGALSAGFKF